MPPYFFQTEGDQPSVAERPLPAKTAAISPGRNPQAAQGILAVVLSAVYGACAAAMILLPPPQWSLSRHDHRQAALSAGIDEQASAEATPAFVASSAPSSPMTPLKSAAAPRLERRHQTAALRRAVECMSLVAYGESRGDGEAGMRAAMWTLLNRVDAGMSADICEASLYPNAYQALDLPQYGKLVALLRRSAKSGLDRDLPLAGLHEPQAMERGRSLARQIVAGQDRDPTHGATSFLGVKRYAQIMRSHGVRNHHAPRQRQAAAPHWATTMVVTARIGDHVFLKNRDQGSGLRQAAAALRPKAKLVIAAAPAAAAAPKPRILTAWLTAVPRLAQTANRQILAWSDQGAAQTAPAQPAVAAPRIAVASFAARPAPRSAAKAGRSASIHLASYRSQAAALQGWRGHFAPLVRATGVDPEPRLIVVDIPGQGQFVRLFAGVEDAASACAVLKAKGEYCRRMPGKARAKA